MWYDSASFVPHLEANMLFGLSQLSWRGDLVALLMMTQITIAAVTIYLHRYQTHRALTLHPVISHFFRLWLWLTTGMVTKDWVSIHRKHHAYSDHQGDPHSPRVFGLKKVFFEGAELYRQARKDKEMIERYGHGTPNDWIERHIYSKHSAKGIILMLLIDLLVFGLPGLSMWAVQMMWIPLWAAGVINGIGHAWGYRNFECLDAARNVFPWGFWIGGEELHNNHHTFASSAKFSLKWWEFDLGWFYIRTLQAFGLAKVKKLPPQLIRHKTRRQIDTDTVKAVVGHRFQVLSHYYSQVVRPMLKQMKKEGLFKGQNKPFLAKAKALFKRQENLLSEQAKETFFELVQRFEKLKMIYQYRESLQNIWLKTASSQKDLVDALQAWCKQAEESGIEVLQNFSNTIKSYHLVMPRV
jgi:stearoyl-CoA desaturase (Delta-9 desaturase)